MNATKRKFNALLQGIGARSTPLDDGSGATNIDPSLQPSPGTSSSTLNEATSLSGSMAATTASPFGGDLLSKRRRVGVLGSTSGNGVSATAGGIQTIVLRKVSANSTTSYSKTPPSSTEPPKYCPNDRDQLIRRLGTFQELTQWTPKPDPVNEIVWARQGWACSGKERVRCTLCNKELVVNTNKREVEGKEETVLGGTEVETELVRRYEMLVVDAHQEDCLWKKRGCDDTLLRLPLTNPHVALPALRQRYDDLCTRLSFLPYLFNLRLPESLDLEMIKSQIPSSFFTEPTSNSTATTGTSTAAVNDVALALALTGWQGLTNPRIGAVPNSASCATCLRRLGLWMFKSKEVDPVTKQIIVPAPMDHLDPVREHRFFCPWRNPAAQRNPGSKSKEADIAGWEVLKQTVRNDDFLTRGGEKERARSRAGATTPSRPRTGAGAPVTPGQGGTQGTPEITIEDEEEDDKARDVKDKERWARLRKVKSLFDTKGGKKLRRLSRPGSSHKATGTTAESTTGTTQD